MSQYVSDEMCLAMEEILEQWDKVNLKLRLDASRDFCTRAIETINLLQRALYEQWEVEPGEVDDDRGVITYCASCPYEDVAVEEESILEATISLEKAIAQMEAITEGRGWEDPPF